MDATSWTVLGTVIVAGITFLGNVIVKYMDNRAQRFAKNTEAQIEATKALNQQIESLCRITNGMIAIQGEMFRERLNYLLHLYIQKGECTRNEYDIVESMMKQYTGEPINGNGDMVKNYEFFKEQVVVR